MAVDLWGYYEPSKDKRVGRQRNRNRWQSSSDWYTPEWLIEMAREFFGGEFFDPCPASYGHVPAVNGLTTCWSGRVWLNPPYRPLEPWIRKAITEPVDELLLLVPAYTETAWFAPLYEYPLCFLRGRLTFRTPRGLLDAPHPSVIAYRGSRRNIFAEVFSAVGPVLERRELP